MMTKHTELKQDLIALHGLAQQCQDLKQKISELEALQEEIATRVLNAPNTAHVQFHDLTKI